MDSLLILEDVGDQAKLRRADLYIITGCGCVLYGVPMEIRYARGCDLWRSEKIRLAEVSMTGASGHPHPIMH